MPSIWTQHPELDGVLARLRADHPDLSTSKLASLLSEEVGFEVSKDQTQKRLLRLAETALSSNLIDLADAVEKRRSGVAPEGFAPRTIAITEVHRTDDGDGTRRTSVTYAAIDRLGELRAQPRDITYLDGLGGASKRDGQLIALMGDTQFPYEDPEAWRLVLTWVREAQPDQIVLTGDILDSTAISRWATDPRVMPLRDEIQYAHDRLAELRAAAGPVARIRFVPGNHDARLEKYVAGQAPQLVGIRRAGDAFDLISLPHLLALDELDVTWEVLDGPGDSYMNGVVRLAPDLVAAHGTASRKQGGASAQALVDAWDESVIVGHCHRQAHTMSTKGGVAGSPKRVLHAVETGMLCQRDLGYMMAGSSSWQSGFATVSVYGPGRGQWSVDLARIDGSVLTWQGRRWSVEQPDLDELAWDEAYRELGRAA